MKAVKKLVIVFTLAILIFCLGAASFPSPEENPALYKISEELKEILEKSNERDTLEVLIWQNDIDWVEVEKETAKAASISYDISNSEIADISAFQTYSRIKRETACKSYSYHNDTLIKNIEAKYKNTKVLFKSSLSPIIIMRLTREQINSLIFDSSIKSVSLFTNDEIVTSVNDSNQNTGADYLRDTLDYDGSGIKIGMIEPGVPDKYASTELGLPYFTPDNVFILNSGNTDPDNVEHATIVAAIMVGKSVYVNKYPRGPIQYRGVVPNAQLYAYGAPDTLSFFTGVEALINNNVNIINASLSVRCGDPSSPKLSDWFTGIYGNIAKWIDHLAFQHDVHMIIASGNNMLFYNPNNNVASLAMAYNAITVGSYNNNNNHILNYYPSDISQILLPASQFQISGFSGFAETAGPNKPDLVAVGENIEYGDLTGNIYGGYSSVSGTSFAAPQVSGIVAQLCQIKPSLLQNQSAMKAILSAGATYRIDGDTVKSTRCQFLFDKQGAGIINARAAMAVVKNARYRDIILPTSSSSYTFSINVPSSYTILRIAMSWIKKNTAYDPHSSVGCNDSTLVNLDLHVSKGSKSISSSLIDSNVEIVEIDVTDWGPGTYTIKINNCGPYGLGGAQYIGIAWY